VGRVRFGGLKSVVGHKVVVRSAEGWRKSGRLVRQKEAIESERIIGRISACRKVIQSQKRKGGGDKE
jgi:hypothetical protein